MVLFILSIVDTQGEEEKIFLKNKCFRYSADISVVLSAQRDTTDSILGQLPRGVQPFGISGPHWKKRSPGPHIKYIAT